MYVLFLCTVTAKTVALETSLSESETRLAEMTTNATAMEEKVTEIVESSEAAMKTGDKLPPLYICLFSCCLFFLF